MIELLCCNYAISVILLWEIRLFHFYRSSCQRLAKIARLLRKTDLGFVISDLVLLEIVLYMVKKNVFGNAHVGGANERP